MAFAKTWSDDHRNAVVAACLDHGLSYRAASDRAAKGTLPTQGELEPFSMPYGTIATYCQHERRRRATIERQGSNPAAVLTQGIGRLADVFTEEVARIERQQRAKTLDIRAVEHAARAGQAVLKLQQELAKVSGAKHDPAPDTPDAPTSPEQEFLDALPA